MPATGIRDALPVVVQTADRIADAAWVDQPGVRYLGDEEGAGQVVGSATFEAYFGSIAPSLTNTFATLTAVISTIVGKCVRALILDPLGSVTIGGLTYTAVWWGFFNAQPQSSDGGIGGVVRLTAVGLLGLFELDILSEGFVWNSAHSAVYDPGFVPPFNALPGGDRSSSTASVNGVAIYVHDLTTTTAGSGNYWSARQILDALIAVAARKRLAPSGTATGWAWVIADPDACLDYRADTIDTDGMTLWQVLVTLAGPRRGMTYWISVVDTTVTINVRSGSSVAITVGTGTLPASTKTATLSLAADPFLTGLLIDEDHSSVYDVIEVRGARPWVGMTLSYDPSSSASSSLILGHSAAAQTSWGNDPTTSMTDQVYRRFEIKATWPGTQYADATVGLRDQADTTTSADYGTGGYTGGRTFTAAAADAVPTAYLLKGEGALPCSPGFSTLRIGCRQAPVVVFGQGTTWEDVSQYNSATVQESPLAVVVEDGEFGAGTYARLFNSDKLLVTIGLREIQPLRVSWQRAPASWPRTMPRIKRIDDPSLELWVVLKNTVTGVDSAQALTKVPADITVRDDTPRARALLALALAWFSVPAVNARWTNRGTFDYAATYAPGTLVTTITKGDGGTVTCNSVISRRRRSIVYETDGARWDTSYETERVLPELEAIT